MPTIRLPVRLRPRPELGYVLNIWMGPPVSLLPCMRSGECYGPLTPVAGLLGAMLALGLECGSPGEAPFTAARVVRVKVKAMVRVILGVGVRVGARVRGRC